MGPKKQISASFRISPSEDRSLASGLEISIHLVVLLTKHSNEPSLTWGHPFFRGPPFCGLNRSRWPLQRPSSIRSLAKVEASFSLVRAWKMLFLASCVSCQPAKRASLQESVVTTQSPLLGWFILLTTKSFCRNGLLTKETVSLLAESSVFTPKNYPKELTKKHPPTPSGGADPMSLG